MITRDNYREFDALNWSRLKHLYKSAEAFNYHSRRQFTPTRFTNMGSAIHCLAYEPAQFGNQFFVVDCSTRNTKAYRDASAANPGRIGMLGVEHWEAVQIAAKLLADDVAGEALSGDAETPITWTDERTGILCKARIDNYNTRQVELKSTSKGVEEEAFERQIRDQLYHCQCAFYLDGLRANGIDVEGSTIVAVHTQAPYSVAVYDLDETYLEVGRAIYRELLDMYAACKKADRWPGPVTGRRKLVPPDWYARRYLEEYDMEVAA